MMDFIPVSQVAEINPRLPKEVRDDARRKVSFLAMADVSEEGRIIRESEATLEDVVKGYTYFRRGDVLSAKITPCMQNGKATGTDQLQHEIGFGSTEFHVLRPSARVDGRYLFHMVWSKQYRSTAALNFTGTAGQQRVPRDFFDRFKIPLPPLPEQRRIAAILDQADAIRRKRQKAIRGLTKLPSSLFCEWFGDPITNSRNFPMVELHEVISLMGGFAFRSEDYQSEGIPLIRIGNANNSKFREDSLVYLPRRYQNEFTKFLLYPGDMIMTLTGTVGKDDYANIVEVPNDYDQWLLNQRVAKVTITDERLSKQYLIQYLMTPHVKNLIRRMNRGVRQANLRNDDILSQRLPLPPEEQQSDFAVAIEQHEKLKGNMRRELNVSEKLFGSLVQRAFRGELSPVEVP